jgi:farnesyl diphosphate synthase
VTFSDRLSADAASVQALLHQHLAAYSDQPVVQAMRYAVQGGKGLRGFMVMESARLHGVENRALPAAAAVEAMHAYSLIHDDLPCMDDDDLRRGLPTVHVKWNEATAVLAGDALQTLAFELLTDPVIGAADRRIDLVAGLAGASGAAGMVYGQALDIAAETAAAPLTLDRITELQAAKTGALISWSALAGARIAGAETADLARYAAAVGLAFQIADDILDVIGNQDLTGKRVGKDAGAGKATFVSLLGIDGARARAKALVAEAEAALTSYGPSAKYLIEAARFVVARQS